MLALSPPDPIKWGYVTEINESDISLFTKNNYGNIPL